MPVPHVVLLARDPEAVARCLRALGSATPLLAGGTDDGRRALRKLAGDEVTWLDADGAAAWNAAAAGAPGADLLLLDDATELDADGVAALAAVGAAEPDAATVTPVSNHAGFLTVPRRNLPWPLLPGGMAPAQAAVRLRDGALGLHPRIPTALPHAVLVRGAALQLVGMFDVALEPREALADFCARATAAGLVHVAADEVFAGHRGPESGLDPRGWAGKAAQRHPALAPAVQAVADDRHSALARALLAASVALEPLSVTVDARNLTGGVTGTTVHVVELLGALAARDDVRVRALLPEQPGAEAARALAGMAGLERIGGAEVEIGELPRTHVAHRPWQVESVADVALLDRLGERTVLTHQDLIGYRTPSVFGSVSHWQDYRRTTADALGLAAMVLFFSPAAAADAAADDLVAPERSRVVPLGTAPVHLALHPRPARPAGLEDRERPFLLVLGNRFRHKNVRFALELLAALHDAHGFDGDLVMAGADVLHGSGSSDDAAWTLAHSQLADHVVELGSVTEPEKAWLLHEAAAVVYASTYEGFGLVPFEAAAAGTPCLVAPVSALRDAVPAELALLQPWDAAASAARVAPVLADDAAREWLVAGLRRAGAELTWERTAAAVVDAYRDAVRLPAPPAARIAHDLARAEHDYWSVREGVPEDVWRLVRPDAPRVDEPLARDLSAMLEGRNGRQRLLRAMKIARRLPGG